MTEKTLLDLDSMMNETLDAIQEAPDYNNPPAGEYMLNVNDAKIDKYKDKAGKEAQRLKITYSIAETLETVDNEAPVPNGSLFTETFQATEQGLSFFKKRIRELMQAEDVQGVSLGDMMSSVKGQLVKARITIKKTPKKENGAVVPGEFYENLNIRIIPNE
jgi:hypothetical protein